MSSPTRALLRAARTRTAVAATALLGAAGLIGVAAAAPASAADSWSALRQCESGGNYSTNTGNGFYGAYQFDASTWHGLGYSGLPSQASAATQDAAAAKLQAQRGWGPWPACSAKLGLRGTPAPASANASAAGSAVASRATTSSASRSAARHVAAAAPAAAKPVASSAPRHSATSAYITTAMVGQVRDDVRTWQRELTQLGHPVAVDGQYGAQTAAATRAFQAEHGLSADGVVGPASLAAMAKAVG